MLPYFQQEVTNLQIIKIQDIFSSSASSTGFQIIEKTESTAIAIHNSSYSLKSMISCFILGSQAISLPTSVKLEILSDESSTLIILRLLSGDSECSSFIIKDFQNKLNTQSPSINPYFYLNSFESESNLCYESSQISKKTSLKIEDFSTEILKIITKPEFGYSSRLLELVERINENINDRIFDTIDEQTETILKDLVSNYKNIRNNRQNGKFVIEKYVYSKVYQNLAFYYGKKNIIVDEKFESLQSRLKFLNFQNILDLLSVSDRFRLIDCNKPYEDAIIVLNRLNKLACPIDKINCLISTVACMKSCVVNYWKGKFEISTMDDELPILMFLLINSKIRYPSTEFEILSHYVFNRLENESRIITNFVSAVTYLALYFVY